MVIMVGGLIKCDPFTCPGDHLKPDHVVRGLPIAQSSRSAGIVSDHAADGAAILG